MLQVCYAMAVAEQVLQFEHRDLHWGNVLIARQTTVPTCACANFLLTVLQSKDISFLINGKEVKVNSHGIAVNIIDFTLSRLCVVRGSCAHVPLSAHFGCRMDGASFVT